ncbi:hypothetical protein MVEN_02200600 [Mycena venus]|uniref:Uncharacterized protein n=1 Tax=Mycena venus TaxID=2733690 RepID=A0A8H7CGU9_9AGAR|nr:hypothetical protein MVEN_02200600 [Mycena venus]
MSSPVDRFRIPGGSLDLDFDEQKEDDTTQGQNPAPASNVSMNLRIPVNLPLSLEHPPPTIQPIAHLTPADLSNVLCRISHPLASRTAEYVRALNLSGNAFRNLDLSALNVLSNHDPNMADQLLRIRDGFLPCALPPEDPIQQLATVPPPDNEPSPLKGASSLPVVASYPPTPAAPVSSDEERRSDDTNSSPTNHNSSADPVAPAHSIDISTLENSELKGALSSVSHSDDARQDDERISPSSNADGTSPPDLVSYATTLICLTDSSAVSFPEQRSDERAPAIAASRTDDIHTSSSDPQPVLQTEIPDEAQVRLGSPLPRQSGLSISPEAPSEPSLWSEKTGSPSDGTDAVRADVSTDEPQVYLEEECDRTADPGASQDHTTEINAQTDFGTTLTFGAFCLDSSPGAMTVASAGTSAKADAVTIVGDQTNIQSIDLDGMGSQARAPSDTAAAVPGAKLHTGTVSLQANQDIFTSAIAVGGGSSESDSGAISKAQGPPDLGNIHILTLPTQVAVDESASAQSSAALAASDATKRTGTPDPASMSFLPLQRDIVTPASSVSMPYSVLDTPLGAGLDHVENPSFLGLEFDLLHFSPLSFDAQLVHDAQMPGAVELFKCSAFPLGTDALDIMAGGSCEAESEYETEFAHDSPFESALDPKQISLAHDHTSSPLSSTVESQSPTVGDGGGITLSLHENSNHENGDRSPAVCMSEEVAAENVHNRVNQVGDPAVPVTTSPIVSYQLVSKVHVVLRPVLAVRGSVKFHL